MKKIIPILLSFITVSVASADEAQCTLQVRTQEGSQTKVISVESKKPYYFLQESFNGFFFQFAFRSDGPADGPVGKIVSFNLMIRSGERQGGVYKLYGASSTSYPPNMSQGNLSLVLPGVNEEKSIANMTCSNL